MTSEEPALKVDCCGSAFSWYETVTETANAGFIWKYRKGLSLLQGAVRWVIYDAVRTSESRTYNVASHELGRS